MFEDSSSPIGDNLMSPFVLLAKQLKKLGHKASTIDTEPLENFNAVVFIELPLEQNKYFKRLIKKNFKNLYLIISESPIIRPDNIDPKNHKYFKKVFTWSDSLCNTDSNKYLKLNYAFKKPENLSFDIGSKEKLCALIAGNKIWRHQNELYSERVKAIRWFEKNAPEDFDLYGIGWDRYNFNGNFLGFKLARLNRLTFLAKLLGQKYPSWKGKIKSKNETLKKYKFAICYENCRGFDGYITEKIFDCFFAGCVPIYLGADNIEQHIPKNTFIDKRKFSDYSKLYEYIKNMPEKEYENYLSNIKSFILSEKFHPFSDECFANTIIKEII